MATANKTTTAAAEKTTTVDPAKDAADKAAETTMTTDGQTPHTPDPHADQPTPQEVRAADEAKTGQSEVPADDPNKPNEILDESEQEKADRHVASTELPVGDLTDPSTQADTSEAEDAKELIVPGAAAGPDVTGTVLNDHGKVAYAPPGSYNAAVNGVQQDASGHVSSVGTDNSPKSNSRA